MTSFSYIVLDVIYSRCQCLRVAYLFLFLMDMGSCDSHFILLELWLPTCGVEVVTSTNLFSNDFNLDSHRCKQDTTFRTKVTCTKRLRSFRMHRRFQLVIFMLV